MLQNILFLSGAVILIIVLWGIYQFIGEYLFLITFVALLILLFSKIDKPKFGNKEREK